MNGKAFLQSIRDGLVEWRLHAENIERLRATLEAQSPRYKDVKVQESHQGDKIGMVEAQIDDLERTMQVCMERVTTRYQRALIVINRMPSAPQRRVLISYYLGQNEKKSPKTWGEVCDELGYTIDHAKYLQRTGLKSYDRFSAIIDGEAGNAKKRTENR